MVVGNLRKQLLLAAVALAAAGSATSAEHDFIVYGEQYNPDFSNQPWEITMDGETLIAPSDACGMVFEGDSRLHWYSDSFGLHDQIWIEFEDGKYAADVFLPGPGCGAWTGLKIENVDRVDNDFTATEYTPPSDFSGRIEAEATGFWTDGGNPSHKLIYLHQPCTPLPQCLLGGQDFVVNGWSEGVRESVRELGLLLAAIHRGESTAMTLLNQTSAALAVASRDQDQRIQARRQFNTRSLEPSIRQLEDIARRRLALAQSDLASCSGHLRQGRRDAAYRMCSQSLLGAKAASAALDTADSWVELR